jgi:hypothetical protein
LPDLGLEKVRDFPVRLGAQVKGLRFETLEEARPERIAGMNLAPASASPSGRERSTSPGTFRWSMEKAPARRLRLPHGPSRFFIRDGLPPALAGPPPSGPRSVLELAGARPGATVLLRADLGPARPVGAWLLTVPAEGRLALPLEAPEVPDLVGESPRWRAWVREDAGWTATPVLETRPES